MNSFLSRLRALRASHIAFGIGGGIISRPSPLMGEGYEGLATKEPSRSWMGVMFGIALCAEAHPQSSSD